MAVIKALKIRDKDGCQYPREGKQTISCPSVPIELVFPLPLLRKASSSVLPLMHVTRGLLCICSFAFFPFKNNLWFVCFYTIQISWLGMRHCSYTITLGV